MPRKSIGAGTLESPLPAVMVTCGDIEGKRNIITVAWTGIINSEPPMCYVSVRRERFSHDMIRESGEFVINLVSKELTRAMDWCGVRSGRDFDKFAETGLTPVPSEKVKCPSIEESPISLECRVKDIKEMPTHDMFMAEIVNVTVDEKLVSGSGKVDFEKAQLIASVHGGYYGLEPDPLGRFGFSVMKPKTKKRIEKQKSAERRNRTRRRK
jgi:Conserved protein/domain typically associated with flavoprotein oxygenases, DIM6/NTAB family